MADDMGYGDLSALGNDTLATPNIDRLARGGITLAHHLSAASVCTPSRAAFLTGRYPIRTGMASSGRNRVFLFVASSGGLPKSETTFAKSLQQLNYSTALIGKWHLGQDCHILGDNCHHPNQHGFEHFFGLPLTNLKDFGSDGESVVLSYFPHFYPCLTCVALFGVSLGFVFRLKHWTKMSIFLILFFALVPSFFILFQRNIKTLNSVLYLNNEIVEQPIELVRLTDRLVKESTNFIRKQVTQQRPFLLVLNFIKVHTAHAPSARFEGKSLYGKYGDCVLELDHAVGKVLDLLEELQIENNTLVYFSSDNGAHLEEIDLEGRPEGGSNGIFRGGKGHGAMEGGIRVPSFARWPNVLPAKVVINAPTMQMDMFATIHHIVNLDMPQDRVIDGRNIFELLRGHTQNSPHQYLYHYCGTSLHGVRYVEDNQHVWKVYFHTPKYKEGEDKCAFMCMCFGKKVITHEPPLMYNIAQDLSERNPIDHSSDLYRRVLDKVRQAVSEHQSTLSPVPSQFSFANSVWKPWLQPCCKWPWCHCH